MIIDGENELIGWIVLGLNPDLSNEKPTTNSLSCGWTDSEYRGPFEKFVDSPYYSESKLCGGVVTVYF
jgi:hypothetical protein